MTKCTAKAKDGSWECQDEASPKGGGNCEYHARERRNPDKGEFTQKKSRSTSSRRQSTKKGKLELLIERVDRAVEAKALLQEKSRQLFGDENRLFDFVDDIDSVDNSIIESTVDNSTIDSVDNASQQELADYRLKLHDEQVAHNSTKDKLKATESKLGKLAAAYENLLAERGQQSANKQKGEELAKGEATEPVLVVTTKPDPVQEEETVIRRVDTPSAEEPTDNEETEPSTPAPENVADKEVVQSKRPRRGVRNPKIKPASDPNVKSSRSQQIERANNSRPTDETQEKANGAEGQSSGTG